MGTDGSPNGTSSCITSLQLTSLATPTLAELNMRIGVFQNRKPELVS